MTATASLKRLYKSRTDRMLDGICGGVAEYFGLDTTLVRIAWVLLTLLGGAGILLYLVAMIIMPSNPDAVSSGETAAPRRDRNTKFWGILLIAVGAVWFLSNIGFHFWRHWWGMSWDILLPVLLILAGVAFIFGGRNSLTNAAAAGSQGAVPGGASPTAGPALAVRLTKSRTERKMFGVCGGLGLYFAIDPTLIRLLFIIAAFASLGFMLVLYVVMAIVVPEEPIVVKS